MKSKLVLGLAVLVWISWGGGSLLRAQQPPNANRMVQAVVFDAYGTLFNPHTVVPIAEELFPGRGAELSNIWRAKQLEYTWLRGLMGQYEDFWQVTESALLYACKTLQLQCGPSTHERMMESFISSNAWDIIGAKAFGFWTCWVNRSGATMDELGFRPDATVSSLADVVNVLPGR